MYLKGAAYFIIPVYFALITLALFVFTNIKRAQKIGNGNELENYDIKKLPTYIYKNLDKFKEWIN